MNDNIISILEKLKRILMVRLLLENEKGFSKKFEKLLGKRESVDASIDNTVDNILVNIKQKSDRALLEYTNKFDNNHAKKFDELVVKKEKLTQLLKINKK